MERKDNGKMEIEPLSPSPEDEIYKEIRNFQLDLIIHAFMVPNFPMTPTEKILVEYYPDAQTNDEGQIALKYRQPGNVLLQGNPSGKEYVATTQANICMAWVDPIDVDFILTKKDGCCGGKQQSFHLANESDVRRWTNKGGQ